MSGGLSLPPIPAELRADAIPRQPTKPLHTFLLERLAASPVTLAIIAVCSVLYCLSTVWGPDEWHGLVLDHMGERRWTTIFEGQVYRLLSANFLHGSLQHLQGNMQWLLAFGLLLEPMIGSRRMLVAFLLTAAGSALPYLAGSQATKVIGASGPIFGLGFILIGWRLRRRVPLPIELSALHYLSLQGLALFSGNFVTFAVLARTSHVFGGALIVALTRELRSPLNIGHLGGAIAGLILGYLCIIRAPEAVSSSDSRHDQRLSVLAAIAAAAFATSIIWALGAGKPWQLREAGVLEPVVLPDTPFQISLPGPVRLDLQQRFNAASNAAFGSFDYGDWSRSPVTFQIRLEGASHGTYAQSEMALLAKLDLFDSEARRVVTRSTIDGIQVTRRVSEYDSHVTTTVSGSVCGFDVSVTGHRLEWAAHTAPPAWDGVEERILASLRFAR